MLSPLVPRIQSNKCPETQNGLQNPSNPANPATLGQAKLYPKARGMIFVIEIGQRECRPQRRALQYKGLLHRRI